MASTVESNKAKDTARTADKPATRLERKRVLTPLRIVLLSVLGVLLVTSVALSVYALTYDRVFPGISAYGVDLGGLTREEAAQTLSQALESVYDGKAVTLSLDGEEVTITAQEAGVSLSPDKTLEAVYQAGRSGNVFSRLSFAASSLFTKRTVEGENDFTINEETVRDIVYNLSEKYTKPPVEYEWSIEKSTVEVSGGQVGAISDPDMMTDAVVSSFAEMDFSPLSYLSEPVSPQPLPLHDIYNQVKVEPQSAYVIVGDDNQARIIPHVVGVSFDMQSAQDKLLDRPDKLSIPLVYTVPDLTMADLESSLFRDLLGEYSTSTVGSSQNRVTNVSLTAQYMTGTIVLPGEEFSFNKVVGERTEARGFKMAGAYSNGQLVDAIGGGVCQSSTTLYNAALLANLHIVYRQGHSMTVAYVPLGQDAAVDWGRIDFVFSNDTAYPIRIVAFYQNQKLKMQIWGTKTDDLTVSIENEVLSRTPSQTLTEENPNLTPGSKSTKTAGHDGYTVQTYRIIKSPDGKTVYRNREAKTSYRKVDTVIEVGPGVPTGGALPEEPTPVVTPDPTPSTPDPSPVIPDPTPALPDPTPDAPPPSTDPEAPTEDETEDINDL